MRLDNALTVPLTGVGTREVRCLSARREGQAEHRHRSYPIPQGSCGDVAYDLNNRIFDLGKRCHCDLGALVIGQSNEEPLLQELILSKVLGQ